VLTDYPREMKWGPTVNLVSGGLVACYYPNCEIYQNGTWQRLQNTIHRRERHSSVAVEDAVLLIGGEYSRTTEWMPVDGSPARDGPFTVRHGHNHCTLKISADVIVLTGGGYTRLYTRDLVTQYQLSDGKETFLTPMVQQRFAHACGVYLDADDQQVLLVTGGMDEDENLLSSTEVATYTDGIQLAWKEVGELPTARRHLRAVVLDNVIHVTGGKSTTSITSILSWDPASMSWQSAGDLKVAKYYHAAVAIDSSIIESECSTVPGKA